MAAQRKIKQNQWGNWNGYIGTKKVIEFGTDEVFAGHWMITGNTARLDGYESDLTISAAKQVSEKSFN